MNTVSKTILGWAVAGMAITSTLVGCQDPDYATPTPASGPATATARALFVNASPNAPALNFLVENVSVAQSLTLGQSSNYVAIPTGNIQLRAKAATGTVGGTLGDRDILFRAGATNQNNFGSVSGTSYSVFVTDTIQRPVPTTPAGATNTGGPQFLTVTDTLTAPTAGNARVRVFNFAPDVLTASVRLLNPGTNQGAATFPGRAYRNVAGTNLRYTSVPAGTYIVQVYTANAVPTATTAPTSATASVALTAGKIYTIYPYGLNRTRTLSVGTVLHN